MRADRRVEVEHRKDARVGTPPLGDRRRKDRVAREDAVGIDEGPGDPRVVPEDDVVEVSARGDDEAGAEADGAGALHAVHPLERGAAARLLGLRGPEARVMAQAAVGHLGMRADVVPRLAQIRPVRLADRDAAHDQPGLRRRLERVDHRRAPARRQQVEDPAVEDVHARERERAAAPRLPEVGDGAVRVGVDRARTPAWHQQDRGRGAGLLVLVQQLPEREVEHDVGVVHQQPPRFRNQRRALAQAASGAEQFGLLRHQDVPAAQLAQLGDGVAHLVGEMPRVDDDGADAGVDELSGGQLDHRDAAERHQRLRAYERRGAETPALAGGQDESSGRLVGHGWFLSQLRSLAVNVSR